MKEEYKVLLDTNILFYNLNKDSDYYEYASNIHNDIYSEKIKGYISYQNITEFLAISTNPKRVEKPLSKELALKQVSQYVDSNYFNIIYPDLETYLHLNNLFKKYKIKTGAHIYDISLAAVMMTYNIKYIATLNIKDFKDIKEISIYSAS